MTILLRRITFLGLSHVSDSSESSYVAKDNMTFSCKLMGKSLEGLLHFWNCYLNDTVGYRWSGTFLRSEEFLSQFSDPNHIIGDWSVVLVKLAVKLVLVCVSRRFRASSLKACGQWKWIVFSWPFTLSAVWFPFYDSVVSWMTVNCNRLIRSPNSALEFVKSVLRLPWSR